MKTKIAITILLTVLIISCDSKKSENEVLESSEVKQDKKTISSKAIENFKYNDYILSSDAEKAVRDWSKFQELATQISFLKKADITFFTSEKDTLKNFLDSLKNKIPLVINTSPINARVAALETKLLKLNDDLSLDNYSINYKLKSIKELLIANSNLIYVINKKIEFDNNDVERPQ